MSTDTSQLHLDILDNKRQKMLFKVLPLVAEDFILGGGTALSLQIKHRLSFDFDFFSEKEIAKRFLERLSHEIEIQEVVVDSRDELTFFDGNQVKFTFLFYPFKQYFSVLKYANGLKLFSIEEIAMQKAYTIGRRGAYRDYFDLYCILKHNHLKLEELIRAAEHVYKGIFNAKLFLEQLVYFKDLPDFDIMQVANERLITKDEVREFFEKEVKLYIS